MTTNRSGKTRLAARGKAPRRLMPVPSLSFGSALNAVPIVEDTLRTVQVIWFAAALEQGRLFDVVDQLVMQFRTSLLPVRKGSASALLYEYWQERDERLPAKERSRLYARVFGIGGRLAGGVVPNRALPELWLAFVAAVGTGRPATASRTALLEDSAIRATARALAANLIRYGAGTARPAASLHEHIQQALALLADPDVRSAYGVRDAWQLVDRIASQYLGGARQSTRYRTLANSGSTILAWLARNAGRLNGEAPSGELRPYPTDAELVAAVEAWLAATDENKDGKDDA